MPKSPKKHRIPAEARRTLPLSVWFNRTELAEVKRRAGTLPASTWIREQLLSLMAMP